MLDWQELLRARAEVIRAHFWTFVLIAAFGAVLGFGTSAALYEREVSTSQATIDLLRSQLEAPTKTNTPKAIPPVGSFGLPYAVDWKRTTGLGLGLVTLIALASFLWPRRRARKPPIVEEPEAMPPRPKAGDPISSLADLAAVLGDQYSELAKDQWSKASSYELWQAACLWVGQRPPVNSLVPRSAMADGCLARLKAAAIDGKLAIISPSGLGAVQFSLHREQAIDERSRTSREALAQYAASEGESPSFLVAADLDPPVIPELPAKPKRTRIPPPRHRPLAVALQEPYRWIDGGNGNHRVGSYCQLTLRSHVDASLTHVTGHLTELRDGDDVINLEGPIQIGGAPGAYGMEAGQTWPFTLVSRDLRLAPVRHPYVLHMDGWKAPLDDGRKYVMRIELRSDFEYPTVALVEVDTTDPDVADVKIIEQFAGD